MQTLYLLRYTGPGIPIQAIRDEQDDRALTQHTARPMVVEIGEALADPRSAGPILDHLSDLVERKVDILVAQITRDVREPRAEEEGIDAIAVIRDRVHEM